MIKIDGSMGEGGGQIIRSTLSLAAVLGRAVEIKNIRAKREKPGLMPQHLTAVNAVAKICGAHIENAHLRSRELRFFPNAIMGGTYRFDVGTAGSSVMVAQTIIPPLLFAKKSSQIQIIGGTHVPQSPGYDYFEQVFIRAIKCFGATVEVKLLRAGYFPKGGGQIILQVSPSKLTGQTTWLRAEKISGIIRISNLPRHIAERERITLEHEDVASIDIYEDPSFSEGNSLTIWRALCGACVLGKRGKPAEIVASEALEALRKETHDVDRYLADQLLIYGALAAGSTSFTTSLISSHLKTNAHVIKQLTNRMVNTDANAVEI